MHQIFEYTLDDDSLDSHGVVTACIESGARALLLDEGALPPAFFDVSSGVAGALVQRMSLYHIRMAAVVRDPTAHSPAFQDFHREANRGRQFRFLPTREEAVHWLNGDAR